MKKYVLLMADQAESPVRWHCAFDADDDTQAATVAEHVVSEGFSHGQPVTLMQAGVAIASFHLDRRVIVRRV